MASGCRHQIHVRASSRNSSANRSRRRAAEEAVAGRDREAAGWDGLPWRRSPIASSAADGREAHTWASRTQPEKPPPDDARQRRPEVQQGQRQSQMQSQKTG